MALARYLPADVSCDLAVTHEAENQDLKLVREYRSQALGDVFELPMRHRFDTRVVTELAGLLVDEQIDVIHTHGYKSDILGIVAARRAGIPCLVTPHGFENARDLKLRFFIWAGCRALRHADAVAPLSRQLGDDARAAGVAEERLHYIQNGVDLGEVEAERKRPKPATEGKRRIGFIGQLISRKNVAELLRIFDRIHSERGGDVELLLLGDGGERVALEALAKTLGSHGDIHFLGFREDRLALLHSFDLFTMTSSLEGIPRCLMEACAMGVPVAAYGIPGVDQLLEHDQTGLLAAPGDSDTLGTHWLRILNDSELAARLGAKARLFVQEHYSAHRMAREYTALFHRLTGASQEQAA